MKSTYVYHHLANRIKKESISRLARTVYCMYELEREWMELNFNFLKILKMKTHKLLYTLLAITSFALSTQAQTVSGHEVHLQGSKFVNPLIERWISEYSRTHPTVSIVLNSSTDQPADATVQIIDKETLTADEKVVFGGRYALLPVANKDNPLVADLRRRGINKKILKKIYFEKDIYDDEIPSKDEQRWNSANIYTRNAQAGTSQLFATYFDDSATRLKGKKINGDDVYLVAALRRDSLGLSFNHLAYLFDLQTRQLQDGIAPLPIELGDSRKDKFVVDGSATIDHVMEALQNTPSELIPTTRFAFRYKANNAKLAVIEDFLKWVATEGQTFNNQYGLLTLDAQTIAQQSKTWSESFITAR